MREFSRSFTFLEPDTFSEGTVLHCFFKMAQLRVKILKCFDADPVSGMETVRIRDGKKSDPG
jgi:hypothetical protein